jgi:O-antigen/teichoic acid export membrane protein
MPMKWISIGKSLMGKYKESLLVNRLLAVLSIDILVKLSGVILLPIYLRLMSQDEYGLYGYLLSIIMTFSIVLNFGLYIPISKYYHDYENVQDRGRLFFTILCLLGGMLFLIIFPAYFFGWDYFFVKILFKNQINYSAYRGAVLLALIVSVLNFMLTNFFFTTEKIRQLKRYNIFRIICINVATLFFLFALTDQDKVRTRLTSTYMVELVLFLAFAIYHLKELVPRFSKAMAVSSLKLAMPVMLSAVFGIVINFSDKFFLEKYGSFKDLSYYYLAVSCASVIPMIFTSFQNAWLPLFLKEKDLKKNIIKTNSLLARLFIVFTALSICILVFVKLVLAMGIIQRKYEETIYILPILLISQIISALVPLYSNYLVYFEKTHIVSVTGLFLCGLSLGLCLWLIPKFGVYGAATVSLIANACYFTIYYFIIKIYTRKKLINIGAMVE